LREAPGSESSITTTARIRAMRALVDETAALFHRLRASAASLYGEGESAAGRRGVLRGLSRAGPQTVPQMARARPVSRQHIQVLVDALLEDGLVELLDNPAHRRSHLIRLTSRGEAVCREMERVEDQVYSALARAMPLEELEVAVRTLRSVRSLLADEARWRPAMVAGRGGSRKP
jgi:DNA-binding MarR family transcriptional regulator